MLARISGLADEAAQVRAGFAARLEASAATAWRALEARGALHPEAEPPDLELPPAFAETLSVAIAQERRDGSPRADELERHYLERMPAARVEQLATRAEPNATLFHTPLAPERMPRLRAAVAALDALTGAVPSLLDGAPTLARVYARSYYGGFMPLLYGHAAALAHAARDLATLPVHAVLDRHLAAPLVHELSHLGRRRRALLPLYLDECVAAHVGVQAMPELAFPAPGADNGLYATPWFSQVGQALARTVGLGPLVAAHAGARPWTDVLPAGFEEAAARVGWDEYLGHRAPHFLGADSARPGPWLKLIFGARGATRAALEAAPWPDVAAGCDEADEAMVADGLRAMCLGNRLDGRIYRVTMRPPPGPVRVVLAERRMSTATAPGEIGDSQEYLFPPALAARLQGVGFTELFIEIADAGEIPSLARVLRTAGPGSIQPWRASSS